MSSPIVNKSSNASQKQLHRTYTFIRKHLHWAATVNNFVVLGSRTLEHNFLYCNAILGTATCLRHSAHAVGPHTHVHWGKTVVKDETCDKLKQKSMVISEWLKKQNFCNKQKRPLLANKDKLNSNIWLYLTSKYMFTCQCSMLNSQLRTSTVITHSHNVNTD